MFFLVDEKKKICFGWSAKCGCSFIKKMFFYLTNINQEPYCVKHNNRIHCPCTYGSLPNDYENYLIFIFVRNPYDRIISGMLDKYQTNNKYIEYFMNKWNNGTNYQDITFEIFVNDLITNNFKNIENHHFTNQFSEEWNDNLLTHNNIYFYDIKKINYSFIESLYDKKINLPIVNRNKLKNGTENCNRIMYDKDVNNVANYKFKYRYFYNYDLIKKVNLFYEKDFEILYKQGFKYNV
jgi:hypothetical protein